MTHMLGRASQRPGWRGGWGKKKKKKRVSVTGDKIREQRLLVWTLNPEQMTSCLKVLWAIFYLVAFHIICTFMLRWWPAICQNRTWYTESGSEIRCLPWVGCCVIGSFFFFTDVRSPKVMSVAEVTEAVRWLQRKSGETTSVIIIIDILCSLAVCCKLCFGDTEQGTISKTC